MRRLMVLGVGLIVLIACGTDLEATSERPLFSQPEEPELPIPVTPTTTPITAPTATPVPQATATPDPRLAEVDGLRVRVEDLEALVANLQSTVEALTGLVSIMNSQPSGTVDSSGLENDIKSLQRDIATIESCLFNISLSFNGHDHRLSSLDYASSTRGATRSIFC